MADYTIEDNRWNNRVSQITTYMENKDCGDMEAVLKWNIKMGTENPADRKRYWDNLTNMFAPVEDSPLGNTGRQSTLPQVVQDSLAVLEEVYSAGHSALYATHALFGLTESKRGAYSTPYGDEETYVNAMTSLFHERMVACYKAHENGGYSDKEQTKPAKSWDGTLNKAGLPEIVIPVKEEDGGKA